MDIREAKEYLEENQIDNVRLVVTDLNGMPRGKRVLTSKFFAICEHGAALSKGLYNLTLNSELIPELPAVGFSTGFQDVVVWPDLSTLKILPWDEKSAWVICDVCDYDGSEIHIDPRNLLKKQCSKLEKKGIFVKAGLEYEFYVFRETQASLRAKNWNSKAFETYFLDYGLYDQSRIGIAGDFMRPIWQLLNQVEIPVDSMQVELGPGMFEFPIKETNALMAADRAVLFKVAVKEICHRHGLLATFMAKVSPDYEGLSGAVHHSIVDKQGYNLFHDPKQPNQLSEVFGQWIEGLLQNLRDLTLIFLPTYNSYKRPLPGSFVGNSTTWGLQTRATTFRVINNDPKATRIENRLAGSDANPYLVLAAHLSAGGFGLENKLQARPAFIGGDPAQDDKGRNDVELIPQTLEEAIVRFESSERMKEFFGPAFCQTFLVHKQYELNHFQTNVSDLERSRYLEYA